MKCPYCDQPLPSIPCPECGAEIPEKSLYCSHCGILVRGEESKTELSERVLCKDGSCVGTINEEGICSVCGRLYAEEST